MNIRAKCRTQVRPSEMKLREGGLDRAEVSLGRISGARYSVYVHALGGPHFLAQHRDDLLGDRLGILLGRLQVRRRDVHNAVAP